MALNGESIYGCGSAELPKPDWGWYTRRAGKLYAHVLEAPLGPLPLTGLVPAHIGAVRRLADGGEVVRGEGRGVVLGFPTANLALPETLLPPMGVYASRLDVDGASWPAVTNIGNNPTFGGRKITVETFVMDAPGDMELYDKPIRVHFVEQLRREKQFPGVEELTAQIARDVEQARACLAKVREQDFLRA